MTILEVNKVSGGYDGREIVKGIDLSIQEGEFFGILGPNGSGKTTLIKMLSGLIPLQRGNVKVRQKSIKEFTKKQLAKKIAVLPQMSHQVFPYTVKETIALGRYAHHRGLFQKWTEEDEAIVQKVMKQTNIQDFQDNSVMEHSGGEQQRIFLAQALVQQPEIILLDEPTNHLDLAYQKELLDLLRTSAKEEGLTVIAILHDLNLASLYCDRLLLMENGRARSIATPNDVMSAELIGEVYETDVTKQVHSEIAKPQIHLMPVTNESHVTLDPSLLSFHPDRITLHAPNYLKTVSSGVVGAGVGWYKWFVNRRVDETYNFLDHRKEMRDYLLENGFNPVQTVGMMTAIDLKQVSYGMYERNGFSLLVVVTAGVGNAVDSTRTQPIYGPIDQGTMNTWVFVNGRLSEEAFVQSIVTATEAKTQALRELQILDKHTNTYATGTPTDSVLIAATQQGKPLNYAGTATELGHLVGKAVFTEITKAATKYMKAKHLEN